MVLTAHEALRLSLCIVLALFLNELNELPKQENNIILFWHSFII
jgi:hypothetical protein